MNDQRVFNLVSRQLTIKIPIKRMKFRISRSTSAMLFTHFDLERRWTTRSKSKKILSTLILLQPPPQLVPPNLLHKHLTKDKTAEQVHKPVAPFTNRLRDNNKNMYMEKMLEMFNEVKLNVPLLDAIQQVPAYAKFLKDMCTKKRKTKCPRNCSWQPI